jgi:hypothetical protein
MVRGNLFSLVVVKIMADEDKELPELKELYDELWSDARTMIKDMKKSIFVYLFTGFITLVFSAIMIGTAISDWNKILSGSASTLTYLYAIAGTLGSVFYVLFGVALLYWHNKLKNRYSKLIKIEKELED